MTKFVWRDKLGSENFIAYKPHNSAGERGDFARHFAALIGKLSILECADVTHSIINGELTGKLLKV
jgi:hypothetical protein